MLRFDTFKYFGSNLKLVFVSLVLIAAASVGAQGQKNYFEMRCRGGADLFAIDNLGDSDGGRILLSVNFSPARNAAGPASEGLEPGSCSWIDRTLSENEPQQIQLTVTAAEAQALRAALQNSDAYWSFMVSNTNRGYYETRESKPWKR